MELITKTTVFEENQVLTAGQLNTMQDFLFQESRLTRIRLIGRGISCGLDVTILGNTVYISEGVGVTSWGFLVSLGDCVLTYYKDYSLPNGLAYPYFKDSTGEDIPMMELVTDDNKTGAKEIGASISWSNYTVVLFVEAAVKDLQSCLGKSCDDLGIEKTFSVKKLLIANADLDVINSNLRNKGGSMYPALYNLENIDYPRALVTAAQAKNYAELVYSYLSPVVVVLDQVFEQFSIIYKELPILQKAYPELNLVDLRDEWKKKLVALSGKYLNGEAYGFQYVYDVFDNVIKSYAELRCAAMQFNSSCLPSPDAFPMHLMLGDTVCPPSKYRQEFEYSPLFNNYKSWSADVVKLFGRSVAMLQDYYEGFLEETKTKGVLITPSREKQNALSDSSLPVYFNPKNRAFSDLWNICHCNGCKPEVPLSYHFQMPLSLQNTSSSKLEAPLLYNLNSYNFLRMEGHLALSEDVAASQYKKLQRRFNLPFKVRTVFMGYGGIDKQACRYPDLDSQYLSWRNTMMFYLRNLIKYTTIASKMTGNFEELSNLLNNAFSDFNGEAKKDPLPKESNLTTVEQIKGKGDKIENLSFLKTANKNFQKFGTVGERLNRTDYERVLDTPIKSADVSDTSQREVLNWISEFNDYLLSLVRDIPLEFSKFDEQKYRVSYAGALDQLTLLMKVFVKTINREKSTELISYLLIATYVQRLLSGVMINGYTRIASLTDVLSQRNAIINLNESFTGLLKTLGGVEHLAGVERGNTLLLVYHTGSEKDEDPTKVQVQKELGGGKVQALANLEKTELEVRKIYDSKMARIKDLLTQHGEELKNSEIEIAKVKMMQISSINNKAEIEQSNIKKAEETLQTEMEIKLKSLNQSTRSNLTKGELAKATAELKKTYEFKITEFAKEKTVDVAKETATVQSKLDDSLREAKKRIEERLKGADTQEKQTRKEYEDKLAEIEKQREEIEKTPEKPVAETPIESQVGKFERNYRNEAEAEFAQRFDKITKEIGEKGIKNLTNTIIADFTIYEDSDCCGCNPDNIRNKEITPLPIPVTRVIAYSPAKGTISKVQLLNNLYHPDFYEVGLKTQPALGKVSFTEEVYEPEPEKTTQIMTYTLDSSLVAKDNRLKNSLVILDEFDYLIKNKVSGEEMGSAKISFFISIGRVSKETFTLSGTVQGANQYNIIVYDEKASVELQKQTFKSSNYTIELAPGKYQIKAILDQGLEKTQPIIITNDDEILTFDFRLR